MVGAETETETKGTATMETVMDLEWESEACKAKFPPPPKPIVESKKEDSHKTLERTNSSKDRQRGYDDEGWSVGNTGKKSDVSDFGPEKVKPKKEEVKVGKLNAADNAFLRKDKDDGGPKKKPGKRVIRDSPFKKSTTHTGDKDDVKSPVSKNSGFKRQLTTGTRPGYQSGSKGVGD